MSIASMAQSKDSDGQYAVVFSPNKTLLQGIDAVGRAGGRVVRVGAFDNILIIQADSKDVLTKLRNSDALATFNPLLVGACSAFSISFDNKT